MQQELPPNFQVLTVSWQALSFAAAVLFAVITAATVYLRMFIKGENATLKEEIKQYVGEKFASKEMSLQKERDQDLRLTRIESAVFQSVFQKQE